jgi:NADP-dependent 3-hydroxy acid dehydrogenase YdfG
VEALGVKVAITGHTSGIGLALADAFRARGDEVVGLSRSTGYDMAKDRARVVEAASRCDLFVNNRHQYNDDTQLQLLFGVAEAWKGQDKTIINLGSRAGECYIQGRLDPYSVYKRALDAASQQFFNRQDQRPRVVNIRPGWVDTDSVKATEVSKLSPRDVASVVMWVVDRPRHIYVSSVTLAHHVTFDAPKERSKPGIVRRGFRALRRRWRRTA